MCIDQRGIRLLLDIKVVRTYVGSISMIGRCWEDVRSTSFTVYESGALLSWTIWTTCNRSSSPSFWSPSASLSMSTYWHKLSQKKKILAKAIIVILTFFSVFFFFFALSSPVAPRFDLTPFSSPGTGPDSRNFSSRDALGCLKV